MEPTVEQIQEFGEYLKLMRKLLLSGIQMSRKVNHHDMESILQVVKKAFSESPQATSRLVEAIGKVRSIERRGTTNACSSASTTPSSFSCT